MNKLQLALPVLILSVYSVDVHGKQPSMADTKSWLESEGQKSMRVSVVKTGPTRVEKKEVSVSALKLDGCALSWTERDDQQTAFVGNRVVSEIRFQSTSTVPLEDIQTSFTRVDVDRSIADAPVYVVYMQTSRPTISVLSGEVAGEGSQGKGKLAPPKRYTERSAKILVNTLDEAQRITDAVLRAAALCGAR